MCVCWREGGGGQKKVDLDEGWGVMNIKVYVSAERDSLTENN